MRVSVGTDALYCVTVARHPVIPNSLEDELADDALETDDTDEMLWLELEELDIYAPFY
jgi:hypothetical protein